METCTTLPDALSLRAQVLAAAANGAPLRVNRAPVPAPAPARGEGLTVKSASEAFIKGALGGTVRTNTGGTYKPATIDNYEAALRNHVLPSLGDKPAGAVTAANVRAMANGVAATVGVPTGRAALAALSAVYTRLVADDVLNINPCRGVRAPSQPPRPARSLEPGEVESLLTAAALDDERLGRSFALPLVTLLRATGLRIGEALALRWGADGLELSPPTGVVHVRGTLYRGNPRRDAPAQAVYPKRDRSYRDVPLTGEDAEALRRYRTAAPTPFDGSLVFPSEGRGFLPYSGQPRCTWKRIAAAAGVAAHGEAWHVLRHTFASSLIAAGVPVPVVAKLLGDTEQTVITRYLHPLEGDMAAAQELLAAWRVAQRKPA